MACFLLIASGFLFAQEESQTYQGNDFTFVRLVYNGRIPGYIKNWYTDYPTGDQNLIKIIRRFTNADIAPQVRVIPIHSPDLFKHPFIYSAEGGQMVLGETDAANMREYLRRGGFWMIDDFWGTFEWGNFEIEMKKIFPDCEIVDIPLNHPIFHNFFDIEEIVQVPNIGYAYTSNADTFEQEGRVPFIRGIFNEKGNLQVFIAHNTDLMDASEWADDPKYPGKFSTYSYKIFINAIVYSMSH
ncbi:MAG: DUF4159 domain-containing protein [Patescibacteria group bacterium]